MAEFVLKYADPRGEIHQQVVSSASEKELRDKYSQRIRPGLRSWSVPLSERRGRPCGV